MRCIGITGVAGETRVERTMPYAFSGDERVDVGMDGETPVTADYPERDNKFIGTIRKDS